MDLEIGIILAAIVVLLILSAFFSGSETALTASSRARMHTLEQEGNRQAQLVNRLMQAPERIIGTVLLGNNLVNIMASALSTGLFISFFGEVGVAYATIVMTALVVIFSEVLPKTYAIAFPDSIALRVAPTMKVLIVVLRPLTIAVDLIVRLILKMTPTLRDDAANILAAHEEIRGTIELKTIGGAVAKGDAAMLGGVLDLKDLQVLDIMVHRTKMQTISIDEAPQKVCGRTGRRTSSASCTPRTCWQPCPIPAGMRPSSRSPRSPCRLGSFPTPPAWPTSSTNS
jgi:Mg2+/Co2+ transporter CorB